MSSTSTLRCYIKASNQDCVMVAVPNEIIRSDDWCELLEKHLARADEVKSQLRHFYPDKKWEILDDLSKPLKKRPSDLATLLLGKPKEELMCNISIAIRHQPHFNVLTDSAASFHAEGGKEPSLLLLCEFIDNSLEAFRRGADALPKPTRKKPNKIEIHLIYKSGPYDARLRDTYKLQQIVVLDRGPGMRLQQLNDWAELANPTAERKGGESLPAGPSGAHDELPCHADGLLGKFGRGSKASGFYFGESVRVVTSHQDGFKAQKNGLNTVYELLMSKEGFQEKRQNQQDWANSEGARARVLRARPVGAVHTLVSRPCAACVRLARRGSHLRVSTMGGWKRADTALPCVCLSIVRARLPACFSVAVKSRPHRDKQNEESRAQFDNMRGPEDMAFVKELMAEVEQDAGSFTMFVISKIRHDVQGDLKKEKFDNLVRELRDLYFVYTDGLHNEVRGKEWAHEDLRYRYGPVDIELHSVKMDTSLKYITLNRKSLRYDRELSDPLLQAQPQPVDDEDYQLEATSVDRLRMLFHYAVDYFRFKLMHLTLGRIEGMVLYLPCTEGDERYTKVALHDSSRALVFWKGRLIPYAKLSQLLPFMQLEMRKEGNGKHLENEKLQAIQRARALLPPAHCPVLCTARPPHMSTIHSPRALSCASRCARAC